MDRYREDEICIERGKERKRCQSYHWIKNHILMLE